MNQKLSLEFPVLTRKGYGKFGSKLTSGFSFSHPENWWILLELLRRWKFQVLLSFGLLFLRGKLVELKTLLRSLVLWHWGTMKNLSQNWNVVAIWALPKISEFLSSRPEGGNFKFYRFVFFQKGKLIELTNFRGVSFRDTEALLCQKWNLGEIYIIKQSNWELRENFMRRTTVKWSLGCR